MAKILYAASSISHINNFHIPYINALKDLGHEVLIMASGEGADFDLVFEKKMLSLKNVKCQKEIRRILKRENFDAIILNTTLAAFNIRMALPKKNRPTVINLMHGFMFTEDAKGLKEKIFLFAEKHLRKKTDSIIVMNNEDLRSAYRYRLTDGEIRMIKGMGATVNEATETKETIRKRLDSEGKYVMVFVGELSARKNQRLLISAMPSILERIPECVLWLLGDGAADEELRTSAKDLGVENSVRFAGFVRNPTDYMRAADLYVAPCKSEGLPFNVIEALGTEIPIVASDIKGHNDLIEDGVTGLLFAKDSAEEMTEKIFDICEGKVKIDREKQLETYKEYSLSEVFEDTFSTLKELLEKAGIENEKCNGK